MSIPDVDRRSEAQRAQDEQIAAQPQRAPLDLPADAQPVPIETHLSQLRHPVAVEGVVENGVVRPLDPAVKLTEHSRVIIVATEQS